MNGSKQKCLLYRWVFWFFFIVGIILLILQLCFLKYLPDLHLIHGATAGNVALTIVFLLASYVTQASIFALCAAIIPVIITILLPWRRLVFFTAIVLSSILITAQIADLVIYSLYHAHEIIIGFEVLKRGALLQVFPLSSKEILLLLGILLIGLLIQWGVAQVIWRRIKKELSGRAGIVSSTFIIACFCFSYGMMAAVLSVPPNYQMNSTVGLMLLKAARFVPYFPTIYNAIMPLQNRYERTIQTENGMLTYQTEPPIRRMNYPLTPMQCLPKKPLPNILLLIIDTWRFDTMNRNITPNIYHFSQESMKFNHHWSGGNSTQTGIFTLFYGLPGNYWYSTIRYKRPPVLMDELQKNHYQMAIYASATIKFPTFDRNIFSHIKNLRTKTQGKTTIQRDHQITKEFIHFLKTRDKNKPFFGFVFYDAPHNYCGGGNKAYQTPFKPAIKQCARFSLTKYSDARPYTNRYHNAVYSVDHNIEKIFDALKEQRLYNHTIIIVTADHGEQINDEEMGYWSHNSVYSPYQLHVPMLVYWPGQMSRVIAYNSTHFDVAPTLLQHVFNCSNPVNDYSIGQSLFKPGRANYILSSNYNSYAILTKKRNLIFYPNGAYAIRTPINQQLPYATLDFTVVRKANEQLNRYYTNHNSK